MLPTIDISEVILYMLGTVLMGIAYELWNRQVQPEYQGMQVPEELRLNPLAILAPFLLGAFLCFVACYESKAPNARTEPRLDNGIQSETKSENGVGSSDLLDNKTK